MDQSDLLLSVNSFHLELLRPLVKWKVLSIKELFEDSGYAGTYKGFHKVISRLEKHKLLEGFKDVWTKSKRIYLTELGNSLINPQRWRSDVYNKNALFHDSRVTLYTRFLAKELNITHLELDQERMRRHKKHYLMPTVRPDAEFSFKGANEKTLRYYLEIELTQKNVDRIIEKLSHYKEILSDQKILFLFPTPALANTYRNILLSFESKKAEDKILFAVEPGLIKGNFSLERSRIALDGEIITLQKYFQEIGGRTSGDIRETLGRLWRNSFEKFN